MAIPRIIEFMRLKPMLIVAFLIGNLALSPTAPGGCVTEGSEVVAISESRVIAEVEVVSSEAFLTPGGSIQTRVVLNAGENFKGNLPGRIEITTPGGTVGDRVEKRSDELPLQVGKRYVLLFEAKDDGTWSARPHHVFKASEQNRKNLRAHFRKRSQVTSLSLTSGIQSEEIGTDQQNNGIPGSVVTTTGYSESDGQPTRFIACDGGEPIPYLIDVDAGKLPTGMTVTGAVAAVAEALNAWSSVSSLRFRYDGLQSFGVAASSITTPDRRLRIQLHDNFNQISGSTAGIGGGAFTGETSTAGRVGSQYFKERLYTYVILESTTNSQFLRNINNFKRVLTHEIGHALGLGHSSENASEPNAILKAATMYYSAPANSAGATIQEYDVDRIQFGYPVANTPPHVTDRVLLAVTSPQPGQLPVALGVNRIRLRAFDRQGTPLTVSLLGTDNYTGSFSLAGDILSFTPAANYPDYRLSDEEIDAGYSYGTATFQFSDGVNLSRPAKCRIIGLLRDTVPSDGLPDSWMQTHFGNSAAGVPGSGRHPNDDPDGDGLSNRIEFYLNTHPKLAASGRVKPSYDPLTRQLRFTPVKYAPYWIESSPTLSANSWTTRRAGLLFQSSATLASDFSGEFAPAREFYRVVTGP